MALEVPTTGYPLPSFLQAVRVEMDDDSSPVQREPGGVARACEMTMRSYLIVKTRERRCGKSLGDFPLFRMSHFPTPACRSGTGP